MKKIALTVSNPSLDTQVEPRLARSAFILLVEPETMTWVSLPNPGAKANSSAEVRIVQALSEWEVSDIVSGNFGATAAEALRAARITMHRFGFGTTARKAVGVLRAGKFPMVHSGRPTGYPQFPVQGCAESPMTRKTEGGYTPHGRRLTASKGGTGK